MSYIKDPRKFVKQRFEERGAEVVARVDHGTRWCFPDGKQIHIPDGISMVSARRFVREVAEPRQIVTRSAVRARKVSGPKPVLDLARTTPSQHAIQRMTLMKHQVGITPEEFAFVLNCPESIQWSDLHESWVWMGRRIAIPIAFAADGAATIKTILWSQQELWELFPREAVNA